MSPNGGNSSWSLSLVPGLQLLQQQRTCLGVGVKQVNSLRVGRRRAQGSGLAVGH
jgi:hypothetical protein